MSETYKRIYTIVKKIPKGRVATYGQIAHICGIPQHARQVGYALNALKSETAVPWQRVINAKGEISNAASADTQRMLLEKEGVVFTNEARVDLTRFQWKKNNK